jgi:hypothetical protein
MSGSEFGSHASLMLLVAEAAWARIKNRKVARSLGKGFITNNTASMEIISNRCAVPAICSPTFFRHDRGGVT